MTAPQWIIDAFESASDGMVVGDYPGIDELSEALLARLPIEAMIAAGCAGPGFAESPALRTAAREIVLRAVAALAAADHEPAEIAALYRAASENLDRAGVPYGEMSGITHRVFTLPERIAWLAKERPTRIDLERSVATVKADVRDESRQEIEALNDALVVQRDAFEQLIAELREQLHEAQKDAEYADRASQRARRDLEDELDQARGKLESLEARRYR